MAIIFDGSFEALHIMLMKEGVVGNWKPEPNGVFMLRCNNGANLHWASGSKSLWVDGTTEPAEQLQEQLARVLMDADKQATD